MTWNEEVVKVESVEPNPNNANVVATVARGVECAYAITFDVSRPKQSVVIGDLIQSEPLGGGGRRFSKAGVPLRVIAFHEIERKAGE